jgi:hypothetical protein
MNRKELEELSNEELDFYLAIAKEELHYAVIELRKIEHARRSSLLTHKEWGFTQDQLNNARIEYDAKFKTHHMLADEKMYRGAKVFKLEDVLSSYTIMK